jgi:hypothetical protein
MKIVYLFIFLFILLFHQNILPAQNLELISGNKHKTIKAGMYLSLLLPYPDTDPCCTTCTRIIWGRLIRTDETSLSMQVSRIVERPSLYDSLHLDHTEKVFSKHYTLPIMEVPKDSIISITIKGKTKIRKYSTGETIGHVIGVIGIGHLASAPIVGDDDAGLLIGLGLAELFGGLIISKASDQPFFVIAPGCPNPSHSGKRTWKIK